ncbi:hypothetical protein HMPREF9714_03334 [Myroides odoratimimus CCUG 12901]|uniref:hypothetical protein n=1 Tax=Myroides odoratimimus TaxID=76832 RepID=UPI0002461148|nr:hypothetical protein [Myroides odoratimimus]EHO05396.1 hypothetical protein HMPREF9714_03334 [Myroides odoratimimus CCUG 12901]
MRTFSLLLLILLFTTSCGSRKVTTNKLSSNEVTHASLDESITIKELESTHTVWTESLIDKTFTADSIIQANGKVKVYRPKVSNTTQEKSTTQDKEKIVDNTQASKLVTDNSTTKSEDNRDVKRDQYNWWYGLPLLVVIGLIIYVVIIVIKKYYANRLKNTL